MDICLAPGVVAASLSMSAIYLSPEGCNGLVKTGLSMSMTSLSIWTRRDTVSSSSALRGR